MTYQLSPSNAETPAPPRFNREFRLGLVLYGGVSLAIYMNGVCREFYEAVRGRGVYKLLKALTDSDIVVDIISGTSAGGINGVLLAYTLANSTKQVAYEFKDFASIWRDSGNINSLLRKPEQKGDSIDSIFDGDDYQAKLATAFDSCHENAREGSATDRTQTDQTDWFSDFEELDLFVTGTDVLGRVSRHFDNTGKLIEVNDHHSVFVLKHRKERAKWDGSANWQPFKPLSSDNQRITQNALAKLCRITSCFPVAFPVVTVAQQADQKPVEKAVDKRLLQWGSLQDPLKPNTEQIHFVDGGVLDNRPFTYTIREIYKRRYKRPAFRQLFYIDPSPEVFSDAQGSSIKLRPNIWESAVDSLVGLPRYESIAEDLKSIIDQNENVRRYRFLRQTSIKKVLAELNKRGNLPQRSILDDGVYLPSRLSNLRDRMLRQLLGRNQSELLEPEQAESLNLAAAQLTSFITSTEEAEKRDEMLTMLGNKIQGLDVDFVIRQHFFIIEQIVVAMNKPEHKDIHELLGNLAAGLNRQLALLEVIESALEALLEDQHIQARFLKCIKEPPTNADKLPPRVQSRKNTFEYLINLHHQLLDCDLNTQLGSEEKSLKSFHDHLIERVDKIATQADFAESLASAETSNVPTYLDSIQQSSRLMIDSFLQDGSSFSEKSTQLKSQLTKIFENFEMIDQHLYPYEYLSSLQTENLTRIARISPADATRGFGKDKPLEQRLAGIQMRAFGGFMKKSWRSNDILWGRLDGLNRLVDTLLTQDSLANFAVFLDRHYPREPQKGAIGKLLKEAFPCPTPAAKQTGDINEQRHWERLETLREALIELAELTQKQDQDTVSKISHFLEHSNLQELIIHAGQMSILQSDLGNVLEDALSEQFEWNEQLVAPPKQTPSQGSDHLKGSNAGGDQQALPLFNPIEGFLEPAFSVFTTEQLIKPQIDRILADPDALELYFRTGYKVGSERLTTHVPVLIREKLLARTGLVFRNILDSEPTGKILKTSVIYQIFAKFLQTYSLWVEAKDPSNAALPSSLRKWLPLVGWLLLICGVVFVVSLIPTSALVISVSLLLLQLLYSLKGRRNWTRQGSNLGALAIVGLILLSATVGLPLPHQGGNLRLGNILQRSSCPLIRSPWVTPNCASR